MTTEELIAQTLAGEDSSAPVVVTTTSGTTLKTTAESGQH